MSGIVFALLCAVFIAFSQLSLRKSYQDLPPSVAFFFDAIFGLLLWVPLAIFMGISGNVSWGEAFLIIGTGFLWLSFSFAPASIASPITGSNGALTVLFSRFILKEKISARKYLGILFTFIGIIGIAVLRAD